MYAANRHDHISNFHHEFTVTGNADKIAFLTFQNACQHPQPDIPLGIVSDGMLQDADTRRIILYDLHEWLHLTVRDDCRNTGVAVPDQMEKRKILMQILLKVFRTALQEDKTTD